jgi:pimeloyl-ACP methyl ester carboxylesterase
MTMPDRIPLILVPGLLCTARLFQPQADDLADIASVAVADTTPFDNVGDAAAAILAAAPARFALGGLSMGGYVAFEVLRRAPQRVAALALIDTSARPDTPEQIARRKDLIALTRRGTFKGVTAQLLPMLIHPDRLDDAALTGIIFEMAEAVGQDAFIRQQQAIMARPDSRPDLPGIRCPTLILVGEDDRLTPPAIAREMADAIPGAMLETIADCGHVASLERPEAVNAALRRWLPAV